MISQIDQYKIDFVPKCMEPKCLEWLWSATWALKRASTSARPYSAPVSRIAHIWSRTEYTGMCNLNTTWALMKIGKKCFTRGTTHKCAKRFGVQNVLTSCVPQYPAAKCKHIFDISTLTPCPNAITSAIYVRERTNQQPSSLMTWETMT